MRKLFCSVQHTHIAHSLELGECQHALRAVLQESMIPQLDLALGVVRGVDHCGDVLLRQFATGGAHVCVHV